MKSPKHILLLFAPLLSAAPAFAKAITVTPQNLAEYHFDYTNVDRDCWKTTFLAAGETFTVEGCDGSLTEATMKDALERVYKSPMQQSCVKERTCEYGRCREVYGLRELNVELKVISNPKNKVQDWVQREIYSPCL